MKALLACLTSSPVAALQPPLPGSRQPALPVPALRAELHPAQRAAPGGHGGAPPPLPHHQEQETRPPGTQSSPRPSYIRKEKYRPATTTAAAAPMYVCNAQGTPPGF